MGHRSPGQGHVSACIKYLTDAEPFKSYQIVKSQIVTEVAQFLRRQGGGKTVHCSVQKNFKLSKKKCELSNVPDAEVILGIRLALPIHVAICVTSVSGENIETRACTGTM